jgi:membrane-bound serine protease (ClpP class)
MRAMSWYLTLLCCGLILIGLEIFVPGAILGVCGAAALIGAAAVGFTIFPAPLAWLSLAAILFLCGLTLYLWMKFFPRTSLGRAFFFKPPVATQKKKLATVEAGTRGIALSALRPSGTALLEGRRADVLADGTWIDAQAAIEVLRVEGNRIYVRKI